MPTQNKIELDRFLPYRLSVLSNRVSEAIARAYAVSGDKRESLKFLEMAKKAGEEIKNDKDRTNFFLELNGGDWNGVK